MALVVVVTTNGCLLYVDDINDRPQARITRLTLGPYAYGERVRLSSDASTDDNGSTDTLITSWAACEYTDGQSCGDRAFANLMGSVFQDFDITIPSFDAVQVELRVEDDAGAESYDVVVLDVDPPELTLGVQWFQPTGDGTYPLGSWVRVDASLPAAAEDGDNPMQSAPSYSWSYFGPSAGSAVQFAATPIDFPAEQFGESYILEGDRPGVWTVTVEAQYPGLPQTITESIDISFREDAPPCISFPSPAPDGGVYPVLSAEPPRRFQVAQVADDLDAYPRTNGGSFWSFFGSPVFRWSIASPATGHMWSALTDNDTHDFWLDPTIYTPGDQVSLRVDIEDRIDRIDTCSDTDDTCSVDGNLQCPQRVTWHVEIL